MRYGVLRLLESRAVVGSRYHEIGDTEIASFLEAKNDFSFRYMYRAIYILYAIRT